MKLIKPTFTFRLLLWGLFLSLGTAQAQLPIQRMQEATPQGGAPTCKCLKCNCKSEPNAPCRCGTACACKHEHDSQSGHAGHHSTTSQNIFLKMMDAMMVEMDAVPLSGSVERDFLAQMIPHHKGAVEMAKYQIEFGQNFELIQLAKSILAEQLGEINDMVSMMAAYPAEGNKVNPAYKPAMDRTMEGMMKQTPTDAQLPHDVDCCFARVMLPHHQAAVDMALVLLHLNPTGPVAIYARRIIGDQLVEIEQMREYGSTQCTSKQHQQ